MTFGLLAVGIFIAVAVVYAVLVPGRWRGWFLLVGSVITIYWLQPALPIRFSDFLFPTATLGLTVVCWWFTREPESEAQASFWPQDRRTLLVLGLLVVGMAGNRFVDAQFRLTPSRPPEPWIVLLVLVAGGVLTAGLSRVSGRVARQRVYTGLILLLVALFVVLKAEPLATAVSAWWRGRTAQDVTLAAGLVDLNWLGFSYVAFRLIHTVRDRQTGILPPLSLREYVTYVIFAPSFVAGPIDRAERFVEDDRALPQTVGLEAGRFLLAGRRIVAGLFKKFVVADTLALGMALNGVNVTEVQHPAGLWLLLYGYAFRLYFDFSGYTDIAIGLGLLFGIRLPENFDRPYLRTNITAFWQSWHKTLSDWARFYVFSPLSRNLLRRKPRPSPVLIVLLAQLATMITIGLWHGISGHFLAWGVWHGLALFVHKQWSDRTRKWYRSLEERPWQKRAWQFVGWFLTFHYVVIGWVWFVVPDVGLAAGTIGRLFGIGW